MDTTYKEHLLSEAKKPKNNKKIIGATHTGRYNNHVCGDVIESHLKIKNKTIKAISWSGKGCLLCIATASVLTEHLKEKTLTYIHNIKTDDIKDIIKSHIPNSREECILTPLKSIKHAIKNKHQTKE